MKGLGKMMKQAQKLQAEMVKLQEEMDLKTVETAAAAKIENNLSRFQRGDSV